MCRYNRAFLWKIQINTENVWWNFTKEYTTMNMNDDGSLKESITLETVIAKGEQDDILEDYPRLRKEKIKKKPCSKLTSIAAKRNSSQVIVKVTSPRIEELARPTKRHVLITLREKAPILSPAFIDNLIRIIEVESCLTPEEAAQVLRRKKRKTKKLTQLPPLAKKRKVKETTRLDMPQAMMLDRNATICQYLMAERFVKSMLQCHRQAQKWDFHEIADVIMKRLLSLDGYVIALNGEDRSIQQLRFLADVVACWVIEILMEVAETRKEALEEYCKRRQMRVMKADDDNETNSETEDWKQVEEEKMQMEKKHTNEKIDERNEKENNKQKEKDVEKEIIIVEEEKRKELYKLQYDDMKNLENKKELENEENLEREDEGKEAHEIREGEDEERNETKVEE